MANDIDPQKRWSQQTIPPTRPREYVRALLASPLGSHAWTNPLRLGAFTVHDFWDVRREPEYRYAKSLPTEPLQLAQLMLDTGLKTSDIDIAVRVEKTDRDQSITAAMQMHRHLRKSHGLSTTHEDALSCLATAFEASVNLGLGKGSSQDALRSHMRRSDHWVAALHSLTQYDNSAQAQNAYLANVQQALAPTVLKEASPAGLLPLRGRFSTQSNDSNYQHGWDSTGSAMVQALQQADNTVLTKFLHARHDLHGLGAMVVQQRLPFSEFLRLVGAPALEPLPTVDIHRSNPTPEEYRKTSIIEVLSALVDMMPGAQVLSETKAAMANDPGLSDKLQAMVAAPGANNGVTSWWDWNLRLHSMGLVDPAKPSAQMQSHLIELETQVPARPRHADGLKYMQAKDFDIAFAQFAGSQPVLANMALAMLIHSIPNHSKPTEIWDKMKTSGVSWLSKADCARYITPAIIKSMHSGDRDLLPFAAMFLPHMKDEDKAKIAPIVAYGVGVQSIQGLSPTTLRTMWKEHNPDDFKAPIPKQYSGDTYILFALTRKSADELMATLSSMEVRHDVPSYLHCVETWTRQAMALPPAIEDIGPIENLFGV